MKGETTISLIEGAGRDAVAEKARRGHVDGEAESEGEDGLLTCVEDDRRAVAVWYVEARRAGGSCSSRDGSVGHDSSDAMATVVATASARLKG